MCMCILVGEKYLESTLPCQERENIIEGMYVKQQIYIRAYIHKRNYLLRDSRFLQIFNKLQKLCQSVTALSQRCNGTDLLHVCYRSVTEM